MTNTLNTACFLFLFSFFFFFLFFVSSFGLGTYIGYPTAHRSHADCNQLHSRTIRRSPNGFVRYGNEKEREREREGGGGRKWGSREDELENELAGRSTLNQRTQVC